MKLFQTMSEREIRCEQWRWSWESNIMMELNHNIRFVINNYPMQTTSHSGNPVMVIYWVISDLTPELKKDYCVEAEAWTCPVPGADAEQFGVPACGVRHRRERCWCRFGENHRHARHRTRPKDQHGSHSSPCRTQKEVSMLLDHIWFDQCWWIFWNSLPSRGHGGFHICLQVCLRGALSRWAGSEVSAFDRLLWSLPAPRRPRGKLHHGEVTGGGVAYRCGSV